MNEDTWENLDTSARRDPELIREYLNDAPEDLENESWKLEWIILRWCAPENQTEKTPELLRMGEKNSHNQKQLWEDGIKLELHIFGNTDKDLEEKFFFGLQMLRMMMRNTTMNYWGTPEPWRIERSNQQWKEFESSWRKTYDWWQFILTSHFWKEFGNHSG